MLKNIQQLNVYSIEDADRKEISKSPASHKQKTKTVRHKQNINQYISKSPAKEATDLVYSKNE
jgi:hypothetical protein